MEDQASWLVKLCGTDGSETTRPLLVAGPLSAELENGALRYIRFNGVEVLHGIAFLVRDENWRTFSPEIQALEVDQDRGGFQVTYRAQCANEERCLAYMARISATAEGTLEFEVEAEALTNVLTNRIGFVILHPIAGVSGRPVRAIHVDGSEETQTFPELSEPIFDIRALAHECAPGLWVTCRMEGDSSEMEDQRNWTDAS